MTMGFAYEHDIERAGLYLLGLLKSEAAVRYSRFYDGTDETQAELIRGMGFDPNGDDYVPDCPEVFMDVAVAQLEQGGIVRTEELSELLSDETNDYRIEITDQGSTFLERGGRFPFRSVDL
jgi:hypothetical protein